MISTETYAYDPAGNLIRVVDSHSGETRYRYDAAGRLTQKGLPNGILQEYAWDAAGQLLAIRYSGSDGGENE